MWFLTYRMKSSAKRDTFNHRTRWSQWWRVLSFVLWIEGMCRSVTLSSAERRRREWCLCTDPEYTGTLPPVRENTVVYGRRMERKLHFSFRSPLFAFPLHTHYTTGNTCNASRRDFWQRGGGNNFRKPAPFLTPNPLLPPSAPLSSFAALMSAIDLVAGDNSFHRRDMPWWTGAPWTPWLIPGPVLRHASVREALCRTLAEYIDLPRVGSQRGTDAILFRRFLHFFGPHYMATAPCHYFWEPDILTVWIYSELNWAFSLLTTSFPHFISTLSGLNFVFNNVIHFLQKQDCDHLQWRTWEKNIASK